jgi:hypothetical protein
MSVLTNPATSARGSACSQSSRLMPCGTALITCSSRCSLLNTAADTPLCPSNTCQTQIHETRNRPSHLCTRTRLRRQDNERNITPYSENGESGGRVVGDAEAVGLDEEVVLAALGEARVAVSHQRALGTVAAELAADQSGQRQHRSHLPISGGARHRRLLPQSYPRSHRNSTILAQKGSQREMGLAPRDAHSDSAAMSVQCRRRREGIWGI